MAVQTAAVRVDRVFAFVDLSGFTAYTALHGDERSVEVLALFRRVLRDVASREGVRIAKWLGDGAMLVGLEVEHTVATVVEVIERLERSGAPLPLRAGITCGAVILFEGDDHVGRSVNLASRLCDAAPPGTVLLGPGAAEVYRVGLVQTTTGFIPDMESDVVEVPGFADPIPVVRLTHRPI